MQTTNSSADDTAEIAAQGGDALLLALAAVYREAYQAGCAFDGHPHPSTRCAVHSTATERRDTHWEREDVLHEAICCTPASGLPGAMVQLEALHRMQEWDSGDHLHLLREHATWSIFRVLARKTGRTTQDGLGQMTSLFDPFRADVGAVLDEMDVYSRPDAEEPVPEKGGAV